MGVRILLGAKVNEGGSVAACLYDSVTGWAFGPQFDDEEAAEDFLRFLGDLDPRWPTDPTLDLLHGCWLRSRGHPCRASSWDDRQVRDAVAGDLCRPRGNVLRETLDRIADDAARAVLGGAL